MTPYWWIHPRWLTLEWFEQEAHTVQRCLQCWRTNMIFHLVLKINQFMYTVPTVGLIFSGWDFFFFKQHGITDCENFHFYLIATCSHSSNSSFIWLKERARQSWLIQHETSATWLILESNCPKQRLRLWLLKELFRPNTWPITKWPFITLTLPLESCQCLKSVQCHSALCLQSGHTQQHVHFAMTVFTSGIHKRSLPQALLTKREETSSDVQNIDWLTLSCYIRRYCTVCCLFVILQVLE